MCHALRARLSPAEKKAVRTLSGILIPIYASAVLVLLAITMIQVPSPNDVPLPTEGVAVAKNDDATTTVADSARARPALRPASR